MFIQQRVSSAKSGDERKGLSINKKCFHRFGDCTFDSVRWDIRRLQDDGFNVNRRENTNRTKMSARKSLENIQNNSSSSQHCSLQILLQSRSASNQSVPDKISMTSKDMKVLGLRAGSMVVVESDTCALMFRAWPSKTLIAGTASLHRLWWPNFTAGGSVSGTKRVHSVSADTRHCCLSPCRQLVFSIMCAELGSPTASSTSSQEQEQAATTAAIAQSEIFQCYARSSVADVPLAVGQLVGLSWKTKSVVLTLEAVVTGIDIDKGDIETDGAVTASNSGSAVRYVVSGDTDVKFTSWYTKQAIDEGAQAVLSALQGGVCTSPSGQSNRSNNNNNHDPDQICGEQRQKASPIPPSPRLEGFGGYEREVSTCLGTILAGLGMLQLPVPSQADPDPDATPSADDELFPNLLREMLKPPKGLLIHGPPGTGKSRLMRLLADALRTMVRTEERAGKEEIAAAPAVHVLEVSHSVLMGKYQGQAEAQLRQVFSDASRLAPCLVMIDDVDLLCPDRASSSEQQRQAVSCLLSLMDGVDAGQRQGGVVVVATSARPNAIDPAMRRPGRLDKEVELSVPSSVDRVHILATILQDMGIVVQSQSPSQSQSQLLLPASLPVTDVDAVLDGMASLSLSLSPSGVQAPGKGWENAVSESFVRHLASRAHGMVGADLLQVVKEAHFLALERTLTSTCADPAAATATSSSSSSSMRLGPCSPSDEDFLRALSRVPPSALREVVVEVPEVRWGDIGGMDGVKKALQDVVDLPLRCPHLFDVLGVAPPKGVLLYGPPGCSKTLMAKALATESGMNFLAVRGPELLSKWLGESEKAVQTLFRRARAAAPSIIFFDEIDALAGVRGDGSAGVNDRVLSQLLTELDGVATLANLTSTGAAGTSDKGWLDRRVVVVAATNRPDMLDAALIRPGRIDKKVYVPPPDGPSRAQILSIELGRMPTAPCLDLPSYAEYQAWHLHGTQPASAVGGGDAAPLVDCPCALLHSLVVRTQGFSGAEVVAAVQEAAMLAVDAECEALTRAHLLAAVVAVKPQITPEMLRFYEAISAKY